MHNGAVGPEPGAGKADPVKMTSVAILCAFLATAAVADETTPLPAAGKPAPAFQLQSQEGANVTLEQFRGKWVVLYFYPRDATPGCTVEAHNFQRDLSKFEKRKAVILGVSVDTIDSHKEFCAKEGLRFKLLADPDHTVTAAYGTLKEREGTKYAGRVTFLIDPAGVIRKVYDKVDVAKHSEEVLADLDALKDAK